MHSQCKCALDQVMMKKVFKLISIIHLIFEMYRTDELIHLVFTVEIIR